MIAIATRPDAKPLAASTHTTARPSAAPPPEPASIAPSPEDLRPLLRWRAALWAQQVVEKPAAQARRERARYAFD